MRFKHFTTPILALSLLLAPISPAAAQQPSQANLDTLTEVFRVLLESHYTHPDQDKLLKGAIEGMLEVLHDPYSSYMTAEEFKQMEDSINQSYAGVGIVMEKTENRDGMRITQVKPGSPAEAAGLQAGDVITAVNGDKLHKDNINQAQSKIMGQAGTTVELTILRDKSSKNYTVTRQKIDLPTVISQRLAEGVGYIHITSFGETTGDDFMKALREAEQATPNGLVLDLRGNGGGYVSSALQIADAFLDSGTILVLHEKNRQAASINADEAASKIPLVVLVDEHSASASEILAGALRTNNRAKLVGTQTFGKGTMQAPFALPNGGILKVSVDRYEFADGSSPHEVGLTPDIKINSREFMMNAAIQQLLPSRLQTLTFPRTDGEVTLNGNPMLQQQRAVLENGRAYLPLRYVVEAFGAQVDWLASESAIQFLLNKRVVRIELKNGALFIAEKQVPIQQAVRSIDGATYVSATALEQITGQKISITADEIRVQSY